MMFTSPLVQGFAVGQCVYVVFSSRRKQLKDLIGIEISLDTAKRRARAHKGCVQAAFVSDNRNGVTLIGGAS